MIAQWTLNVEGFGKIEKASVRISPFMIFAGDNNSGKSYIMSLLWGILMIVEDWKEDFSELESTDAYKRCQKWYESLDSDNVELSVTEMQMFLDLFNLLLDSRKKKLVKQVFHADIPIKNVYLSDLQYDVPYIVRRTEGSGVWCHYDVSASQYIISLPDITEDLQLSSHLFYLCTDLALGNLSGSLKYLPASRTGFMLTYKALARGAVRRGFGSTRFDDSSDVGKLTTPVSYFLSDLVGLDFMANAEYLSVSQFLENQILQGEIKKDTAPVPTYYFQPNDLQQRLSLHVTSSLVAELSPIVLFLKSDEYVGTLIIEEPEAHLHLDMQRQMARALVRLVNMGLPVWITTHSDTMMQQINNLIKLNKHTDQQQLADQYGYEEIDFLDAEKVSVYQFNTRANKTEIQLQPLTSSGFSVPTFSESIRKLTQETIDLMESDHDDQEDD